MRLVIPVLLGCVVHVALSSRADGDTAATASATRPTTSPTMMERADSVGRTIGETAARVGTSAAEAAGNVLQKTGKKSGEAVGGGVTNMATGLVKGVEDAIPNYAKSIPLALSEELRGYGVAVNRQQCRLGVFRVYLVNQRPFNGTAVLKAFDASGQEIARGRKDVTFSEDDGQEVEFILGPNAPLDKAAKYELGLRPRATTQPAVPAGPGKANL